MSFSWNKWRQYIIEEASVNEIDAVGEITPFFKDAADMGIIRKVDAQRVMDAAGNSEDQDAFESTQEFQQIGKNIIMAAVDTLEKSGSETHYLHQKFAQGEGGPIEGADISNAINILMKGRAVADVSEVDINPEADEIGFDGVVAGAEKRDQIVGKRKPGFSNDVIIDSFMEDFEKATRSTGDIQDAQQEVIMAYKTTFKNFPGVSDAIDAAVMDMDRKARRDVFQNVADDPDVVGRDMMAEGDIQVGDLVYFKGHEDKVPMKVLKVRRMFGSNLDAITTEKGEYDETQLVRAKRGVDLGDGTFEISEMEGEVQAEIDVFDEALNDMALERAAVAKKLDAMQNDLEATLSDDEIDTLSDAIMLLRQK